MIIVIIFGYILILVLAVFHFNLFVQSKRLHQQNLQKLNSIRQSEIERKIELATRKEGQDILQSQFQIINLQLEILKTFSEI